MDFSETKALILFFDSGTTTLQRNSQRERISKILNFHQFLCNNNGCVGGSCTTTDLSEEANCPRIIAQSSELAGLLINIAHNASLHGSNLQNVAELHSRVRISACKNHLRIFILTSFMCRRFSIKANVPLIEELPKKRASKRTAKASHEIGLVFGRVFLCKKTVGENSKFYLAQLIEFARRTVHHEIVSDMTQQACITALTPSTSHRGCPAVFL